MENDRDKQIKDLESTGHLDPNCKGCKPFYDSASLMPFAPSHKAMESCKSGKYNHCTCDTCF